MLNQKTVSKAKSDRRGMSLIEVVLAIAVAGFVMASAVSLMVSVSSIWSERSERYFFVDHVDGVTEFLNATLASTGMEITASAESDSENDNQNGQDPEPSSSDPDGDIPTGFAEEPVRWERPPGFSSSKDPLLHFSVAGTHPFLIDPQDAPSLGILAFLYFEKNEGLSILWHSMLQEEVENINDLRRTLVSPLVTAISYIYWDERFEQWEEEARPQEDDETEEFKLPRFIKLTFEYEGASAERILTIPVPSQSALIF